MSEAQTAEAVAAGDFVTGNFEIQATLGKSGKALRLSGYIYAKNDKEHINAQVDQLMAVCDRQQAAAEIPALEAELERHFSQLRINKGHLEGVQSSNLEFQKAK